MAIAVRAEAEGLGAVCRWAAYALHSGRQRPMLGKGRLRRWCWAPAR